MIIKKSGSEMLFAACVLFALVSGLVGCAGAQIEIRDFGIDPEGTVFCVENNKNITGVIDYQNIVEDMFLAPEDEYYVYDLISIWNDGRLIVNVSERVEVRTFHGFAVSRPEWFEYSVNADVGTHTLKVLIVSENTTVNASTEYEILKAPEEEETEEDWLPCP